jgi:hypothetical protein
MAQAAGSPLAAMQVATSLVSGWLVQGLAQDLRDAVALGSRDAWVHLPQLVAGEECLQVGSTRRHLLEPGRRWTRSIHVQEL